MEDELIDMHSQRFGLPDSLLIPIAAKSIDAIEKYVGSILESITGRAGRINAFSAIPHTMHSMLDHDVPLWRHSNADQYRMRLHPEKQVWVHVDYSDYRKAYTRLDMPVIPEDHVLDHIQNREAIRLRDYSHPYLRLCPVSRRVNTSGGHDTGGEGMEKEFLRSLDSQPESVRAAVLEVCECKIIYADPMDLTKMLDVPPGPHILDGVREMLHLFYPE